MFNFSKNVLCEKLTRRSNLDSKSPAKINKHFRFAKSFSFRFTDFLCRQCVSGHFPAVSISLLPSQWLAWEKRRKNGIFPRKKASLHLCKIKCLSVHSLIYVGRKRCLQTVQTVDSDSVVLYLHIRDDIVYLCFKGR